MTSTTAVFPSRADAQAVADDVTWTNRFRPVGEAVLTEAKADKCVGMDAAFVVVVVRGRTRHVVGTRADAFAAAWD